MKKGTMKSKLLLFIILLMTIQLEALASTCFEQVLIIQERAISTSALQRKMIEITGNKVIAEEAINEAKDLHIWAFGKLRPLDKEISKILTEGKYVYEIKGETGFIDLTKSSSGKLIVSHIGNHSPSDNDVVIKAMLGFQDRGFEFSSKTHIEILDNPTGRYGGVINVIDIKEDLRTPPSFLSRSDKKFHIDKIEVNRAGKILSKSSRNKLSDGEYLFLTFFNKKTGEYKTVYEKMYLPQEDGTFYVGHRSLRRKFKNKEEIVVSAGEFQIQFGEFAKLSNRSGTYMGNKSHLEHARETFLKSGYSLEGTNFIDYAELRRAQGYNKELNEAGVHNHSRVRTLAKHLMLSNESYKELIKTTFIFLHRLHQYFPAEQAGRINTTKFIKFLKDNAEKNNEILRDKFFLTMFLKVQESDGTAMALKNSLSNYMTAEDIIEKLNIILDVLPVNKY